MNKIYKGKIKIPTCPPHHNDGVSDDDDGDDGDEEEEEEEEEEKEGEMGMILMKLVI